jgi:hypothetical protein
VRASKINFSQFNAVEFSGRQRESCFHPTAVRAHCILRDRDFGMLAFVSGLCR